MLFRRADTADARRERRPHSSAMPVIGETITPWLGAAVILALVNLTMVLGGHRPPALEQSVLLVGLGGSLAAAGLVAARSNRELRVTRSSERARPPAEALRDPASETSSVSYSAGMSRWAGAVLELVEHAASVVPADSTLRVELGEAAAEIRDLRDLLEEAASSAGLDLIRAAEMHALGSLWETTQSRIELLAAEVDPRWHRRWRARSVIARQLRHGRPTPVPIELPYCT